LKLNCNGGMVAAFQNEDFLILFLLLIRFLWYKKYMIKEFIKKYQEDIILVIGVILISLFSFAMGYIVAKEQEKQPLRFEETGFIPKNNFFL